MNMIGHYNRNPKIEHRPIVMKTRFQNDRPNLFGKNPTVISAKGNEAWPIVNLKMRKFPPIKRLRHKVQGSM